MSSRATVSKSVSRHSNFFEFHKNDFQWLTLGGLAVTMQERHKQRASTVLSLTRKAFVWFTNLADTRMQRATSHTENTRSLSDAELSRVKMRHSHLQQLCFDFFAAIPEVRACEIILGEEIFRKHVENVSSRTAEQILLDCAIKMVKTRKNESGTLLKYLTWPQFKSYFFKWLAPVSTTLPDVMPWEEDAQENVYTFVTGLNSMQNMTQEELEREAIEEGKTDHLLSVEQEAIRGIDAEVAKFVLGRFHVKFLELLYERRVAVLHLPSEKRTDADLLVLEQMMDGADFFKTHELDNNERRKLFQSLHFLEAPADEVVYFQAIDVFELDQKERTQPLTSDAEGNTSMEEKIAWFYIIEGGVQVEIGSNESHKKIVVDKLVQKQTFGHMSDLLKQYHHVTFRTLKENTRFAILYEGEFKSTIYALEKRRHKEYLAILKRVPRLELAPLNVLNALAKKCKAVTTNHGQIVIKQGSHCNDGVYIVLEGTFQVIMDSPQAQQLFQINQLGPYQIFGELGVLQNSQRTASVVSVNNNGKLLRISRLDWKGCVDKRTAEELLHSGLESYPTADDVLMMHKNEHRWNRYKSVLASAVREPDHQSQLPTYLQAMSSRVSLPQYVPARLQEDL